MMPPAFTADLLDVKTQPSVKAFIRACEHAAQKRDLCNLIDGILQGMLQN
jgi:hypothetical protein